MKVCLITVCYNSTATIGETMASVAVQRAYSKDGDKGNGLEIEYIVIDGGSQDGTVEKIKNFAKELEPIALSRQGKITFKWSSENDKGMYDALNKGVKMATGDVIGILNADDRFEDEYVLADIVRLFDCSERSIKGERIDAVYGDVRFVRGERRETVRYYSSSAWRPWMHYWGYMPAHPSVYVRREVFEKFGGYKLGYDISADFEWMVRIFCREKICAKYMPRCMVTMRLGGKSTAGLKAMLKLNQENVRANRENGYFCCLLMMLPKYFYKILGYIFKKR